MKICTIIGSRPQYIKCATLSSELKKYHDELIIDTGQHYDRNMSEVFIEQLGIHIPDYNLEIHEKNQVKQVSRMMEGIEKILLSECPDLVITYGDTNSTLAGAMSSAKLGFMSAHVESGLRSYDMYMPEEVNRVITDHISSVLFAPKDHAYKTLIHESVYGQPFMTGDIVIESIHNNYHHALKHSTFLEDNNVEKGTYNLLTTHRDFNVDSKDNLSSIIETLGKSNDNFIFPIHPRTKKNISAFGIKVPNNIKIIDPLDYFDSLIAISSAKKVVTDSGGIPREAHYFGVPCITLRRNTEWNYTTKNGWNVLTDINPDKILIELKKEKPNDKPITIPEDLSASKNIVKIINRLE